MSGNQRSDVDKERQELPRNNTNTFHPDKLRSPDDEKSQNDKEIHREEQNR